MTTQTCLRTRQILRNLLELAAARPGEFMSYTLTNNLKVEVRLTPGPGLGLPGKTTLRISRTSSYPTPAEWRTVTSSLPHPVHLEPRPEHISERCCLWASWVNR